MRYRKLDADGDYTTGTGEDFLTDSPAAVGQAVRTRLLLFQDEWFLDARGTPWSQDILGRIPVEVYDAAIRRRILRTPGVTQIAQYASTLNRATRALTIRATIDTQYGQTALETSL